MVLLTNVGIAENYIKKLQLLREDLGFPQGNSVDVFGSKHSQNSQHSQSSILNFGIQGTQLFGRFIVHNDSKVTSSEVTRLLSKSLLDQDLVRADHDCHLYPTNQWDNVKCSKAIGDIREREAFGGAQLSNKSVVFLNKHTQGGSHCDTSMFQFNSTVMVKVLLN